MDHSEEARVEPLRQPQITRLELAQAGDKSASVFSVDFGDGLPPAGLVVLVARREGVRVCEQYPSATGDDMPALLRAIEAYSRAVEVIARSGAGPVEHVGIGAAVQVVKASKRPL